MREEQIDDVQATLTVDADGCIASGTKAPTLLDGFAQLLDLTVPPMRIRTLPPGEPARPSFMRTGLALRQVIGAARARFPAIARWAGR